SQFEAYGLGKTQLVSPLPDLDGTNTISARDLVHTLLLISQGDTLTLRSRDRILNILNRTYNKSLLADGLEEKEALTYNKTGDIASVLGDTALVDLANGKRYAVAVLVERPTNDGRAAELIRWISGRLYQENEKAIKPAAAPASDSAGAAAEDSLSPGEASSSNDGSESISPDVPDSNLESDLEGDLAAPAEPL
ncbi:MAG: serine hydrolase, partial [Phormidesmis sp.]